MNDNEAYAVIESALRAALSLRAELNHTQRRNVSVSGSRDITETMGELRDHAAVLLPWSKQVCDASVTECLDMALIAATAIMQDEAATVWALQKMIRAFEEMLAARRRIFTLLAEASVPLKPPARRPTRAAQCIAATVIRVVPLHHRARYAEEFACELADQATLPRRQQLSYAVRLASRTWLLRRALGRDGQPVPARER